MPEKRHRSDEIIGKLHQADVLLGRDGAHPEGLMGYRASKCDCDACDR